MSRNRLTAVLIAASALVLPAALLAAPAGARAVPHAVACAQPALLRSQPRIGRVVIAGARQDGPTCVVGATKLSSTEPPYLAGSTPPLVNHGGKIMAASSTTNLVITPIFWAPSGYSFAAGYESLIQQYLADVAHDSGSKTNVFSTLQQYTGTNGTVHYRISAGAPITDTSALPTLACTVNTGSVYSDGSGYNTCVDDVQVQAELAHVVSTHSLPTDLNHIYPIFLPKAIESCIYSDLTIPFGQHNACTINPTGASGTAAYCAYHGSSTSNANSIYATMPFPVYLSATHYTCSTDHSGSTPQSPNSNVDADTVISTLSHEVSEAMTDPNGLTWWASDGNENGDLCAYIYGDVLGTAGHYYNQTINGHHYLTQEEFSNREYVPGVAGCEQDQKVPTLTSLSRTSGSHLGGGTPITVHGTSFRPGKTTVKFGTIKGSTVKVTSPTTLTVVAPAHTAGSVNVRVITPNGVSPITSHDTYTFT